MPFNSDSRFEARARNVHRRPSAHLAVFAFALALGAVSAARAAEAVENIPSPPESSPPADEPALPALEVTVTGEAPVNAGSKLREPLRDVPNTVNTVTAKTLRERATVDLVGALQNVAGVNPILQYGGFSYLTMRGFNDFVVVIDGVRDDRYYFVESAPTSNLADVSRIDVLKGPSSALYGYGGIGGIVSVTRKAPTDVLTQEAGLSIGAPKLYQRASAGVGGPIADTRLTYRLDAGISNDRDFRGARAESTRISGALEWRPSDSHRFLARAAFSRDRFNTDTGIPTDSAGAIPAGIPLDRRFNTAFDYLLSRTFEVGATYAWRPAPGLELNGRVNYTRNPYSYASAETLGLGPNDTVTRGWFFLERDWKPLYAALELHAEGQALVFHRALVGYELGHLSAENPIADQSQSDLLPLPYAGGLDPQPAYRVDRVRRLDWKQTTHSVYLHDSMALLPALKLAIGGRIDHWSFEEADRTTDPSTSAVIATTKVTHRVTTAVTWRAGLVYHPSAWATVYSSVATAFRPVRQVPIDGRQLDPERGRQIELGLRFALLNEHVNLNVAAYDIAKSDVVVSRGAGIYDQAGKQSSRGVELDFDVRPGAGFAARLGYAYTRARYDNYQSSDGTDYSHKTTVNVPDHTFTAWATYRHATGVGMGLGGRALGASYADPGNTVKLPAYAIVDAALFYHFSSVEFAVNVNNLFGNEGYLVSSINGTQLTPGAPRVAIASVRLAM